MAESETKKSPGPRVKFWIGMIAVSLAGLLAVFLGVLIWRVAGPREKEPVYQGMTLSQWEVVFNPAGADPSASTPVIDAVRQMGTNAVPFLLRDLHARDGLFWRELSQSTNQSKLVRWLRRLSGPPAIMRQQRAVLFLEALGPLAQPAIPALSKDLGQPDRAATAAAILGHYDHAGQVGMGPEAVEALLKAITNNNPDARRVAANALGLLKAKPELVVPALIHALKDPNRDVRAMAARCFGGYKADAVEIVPPLIATLDDSDPYVRAGATWMLGMYRDRASAAVPKLEALLNDQDRQVRENATNALELVKPAAAAAAGMK